jgi:hypothetical protein
MVLKFTVISTYPLNVCVLFITHFLPPLLPLFFLLCLLLLCMFLSLIVAFLFPFCFDLLLSLPIYTRNPVVPFLSTATIIIIPCSQKLISYNALTLQCL